jgi:hypothetical protein
MITYSKKASIDHDALTIKLLLSDASSAFWPTNTTRIVDAKGQVNYLAAASESTQKNWKRKIGKRLAQYLGLPPGMLLNILCDMANLILQTLSGSLQSFLTVISSTPIPRGQPSPLGLIIIYMVSDPHHDND